MLRTRLFPYAGAMAITSALTFGCAPSLKDNPPREAKTQLPDGFGPQGAGRAGKARSGVDAVNAAQASGRASVGQQSWREFFTDPQLTGLIDTALENNQELNARIQEIIIAQNEVSARKGEYMPKLSAGAGAGLEKVGKYTSQGASDEAHGVAENLPDFTFGLQASWEVDIWKKLRNASKSAALRYLSSIEGKNFMVTQLVAEIANSYYELMALDGQLEVLGKNIEIQKDALEVVKFQKQAGRVSLLAVQRFDAELLKNRSRQFELEQRRTEAENRINFLVGRFPQPVERSRENFLAQLPKVIQSGIPSELLDSRPDVRQAELEMEAAKLDVKVAKAAFLPSLSIDAGVGYDAFNLQHLVDTPESLLYRVGGNLTAPLLNRQGIKAAYRSANARQLQAVFNYERALLQAFTEVRNELSMIENLQKSFDLETQQVDTLTASIEVSNTLFRSARADYMEVLMTRRDSLDASMELIETRRRQMQAAVDVYQALGGGWR